MRYKEMGWPEIRFLVTMLFMMFFSATAFSQKVKGKVLSINEKGIKDPLIGANVYWLDSFISAATDKNGKFTIDFDGIHDQLRVSYVGYVSDTILYTDQDDLVIILKNVNAIQGAEIIGQKKDTDLSLINPLNIQTIGQGELAKAACCNLSESFETNASVDAAYTDAVTGTRQIKMLGLDGKYTQIMQDNIPNVRGLSTIYGLNYIPGPWIDKIYVSKGVGSVTNGYESITGQINVGMKNAERVDKLLFNAYGSSDGRVEMNSIHLFELKNDVSTSLMLHGEWSDQRFDKNNDGFLDSPLKKDFIIRNDWSFHNGKGIEGKYSATYLKTDQIAGQFDFKPGSENQLPLWGANIKTEKADVEAKTGFISKKKVNTSIGTQFNATYYNIDNEMGIHKYEGTQKTLRANLLYASYMGTTDHKFTTGVSYRLDDFKEVFDSLNIDRQESVPGVFYEYTYSKEERFSAIAGIRADYHNLFGMFFTPRIHARYSITELSSIKAAAGKGWRTPNVVMENIGAMASNRDWLFMGIKSFGYDPEEAWNFGLNYTQKFTLNYRDAVFSVDAYHTEFTDQIVTDLDNDSHEISFYNLEGKSYSNSVQAEFFWEMNKRMEIRTAYRWLEVFKDYSDELRTVPFTSRNRAFMNLTYKSKKRANGAKWMANGTVQWIGSQRIPYTGDKPELLQLPERAEDFISLNGQFNYYFSDNFDMYLGVENALNYRQKNPIIDAENPFSDEFDASLVWAPVFGRMFYVGLNFKIPRPDNSEEN